MDEKRSYVRLGMFVVVSLAVLAAALFLLAGRALLRPTLEIETYFDQSVAGLELGAPVNFRGVPIGQVSSIQLSAVIYEQEIALEQRRSYIVVRATLSGPDALIAQWRDEVQDYVRRGLRAQTQLAGITGQLYLVLDYFDPQRYPALPYDWTPRAPYVPSAQSLTGELIAKAQDFMASVNAADIATLIGNLSQLTSTLDAKLAQVPIDTLSAELIGLAQESRTMVRRLDETLRDAPIAEAARSFDRASDRVDALLQDPALKGSLDNTEAITERLRTLGDSEALERITASLDQTLQRVNALVGDNQYDLRIIVEDLRIAADNLRDLSERAKRYPAGILIGAPPERVELPWSDSP